MSISYNGKYVLDKHVEFWRITTLTLLTTRKVSMSFYHGQMQFSSWDWATSSFKRLILPLLAVLSLNINTEVTANCLREGSFNCSLGFYSCSLVTGATKHSGYLYALGILSSIATHQNDVVPGTRVGCLVQLTGIIS